MSSTRAWTPDCSVASSSTCQPLIRFRPKFTRRSRWKWRSEKLWKLDAEATSTSRQRPRDRAPSRAFPGTGSAFRQQQHSAAFSSAMAARSTGSPPKKVQEQKFEKKTKQNKTRRRKHATQFLYSCDMADLYFVFFLNKGSKV